MPLSRRISHCRLAVPCLAAALLFFPLKPAPGSLGPCSAAASTSASAAYKQANTLSAHVTQRCFLQKVLTVTHQTAGVPHVCCVALLGPGLPLLRNKQQEMASPRADQGTILAAAILLLFSVQDVRVSATIMVDTAPLSAVKCLKSNHNRPPQTKQCM